MTTLPFDVTVATAPPELLALPWRDRIAWLRSYRLAGLSLTFVPYDPVFSESLRALRNRPDNQFNLAQGGILTVAQQQAWGDAYAARDNDLCWIVLTPTGDFVGATRLYDIDGERGTAEKGGLVLREELARGAPLALESEIMLLRIAFGWLELKCVATQVRPENPKMISINNRLGFIPAGENVLRGVPYLRAELVVTRFDPAPLFPILAHWKKRHAR